MYILHKPEAAKRVTLPGEKIRDAQLDFNLADVNAARQGDDLVLSFEDGAQLVFTNYFQIHDGNLPELNFADGLKHLGPDDFRSDWEHPHDKAEAAPGTREGGMDGADTSGRLAGVSADSGADARASAPDSSSSRPTAQSPETSSQADASRAGTSSQGPVQDSNYHVWDSLELLDGRPHLGPLDVGWNRGWNQEWQRTSAGREDGGDSFTLAESAVASPASGGQTPPPNTLPVIDGADLTLRVDEAGVRGDRADLSGLADANTLHPGIPMASGSADAMDPDGDALTWLVRGTGDNGTSVVTRYGTVSVGPDGTYEYTLDASRSNALAQGETATDSFTLLVSDGRGGTAEQIVTVTITGTNDAPELSFASPDQGQLEASVTQARNDGRFDVADPDHDGALGGSSGGAPNQSFSIVGNGATPGSAGPNPDGGASLTTAYGTLTIHKDGTYDYVLNPDGAVKNLPAHNGVHTENFVVTVTDAHGSWDSLPISVVIHNDANNAPTVDVSGPGSVLDVSVTEAGVQEGGNLPFTDTPSASGRVVATDADGDSLSYSVDRNDGTYGRLELHADGSYVYTLDNTKGATQGLKAGETKTDVFTVTVSDDYGGTVETTVTVTITGTNDVPELSFADGGADAGKHTLSGRGSGDSGTLGKLNVLDPDADGRLGDIMEDGITPAQSFSIANGAATVGTGTAHSDGSAVFETEFGSLTVDRNGNYSFSSTKGVTADTTLNFVVTTTDAHGAVSNAQTITVILTPDQVPVITSTDHTHSVTEAGVREGGNLPFTDTPSASGKVEATDADNDSLSYSVDRNDGIYGRLELHADGSYVYTLDNAKGATQALKAGETKTDVFTVTVSDGHGGTVSQVITVNVTGTNDVPELSFASGTTGVHTLADNGTARTAAGKFNVADPDADGIPGNMVPVDGGSKASQSFGIAGTDGTTGTGTPHADGSISFTTEYGTLTIDKNGNYTYTLNPNAEKVIALSSSQTHDEHFTVTVTDAHGAVSETRPITVTITGKDDPPKIHGATGTHSVKEEGVAPQSNTDDPGTPSVSGMLNAEHTDGDRSDAIIFDLAGSVKINGTPTPITPGAGGTVLNTAYGTLTLNPTGDNACAYEFVLDNNAAIVNRLAEGQTVTLTFQVRVTDGGGAHYEDLIITITGSNDRPVISSVGAPAAVAEDDGSHAVTSGQVIASDVDAGDSLSYSLNDQGGNQVQILQGEYGRLEIIQGTGAYTYYLDNSKAQSLAEGQTGYDEFTVRVVDKLGAYTEEILRIPITGKDDPPVLGNLSGSVTEDNGAHDATPLPGGSVTTTGRVTATDVDTLDTDKHFSLTASVDAPGNSVSGDGSAVAPYTVEGKYGTLTFHSDGSYTYTLRDNALNDIQKLNVEDQLTDSFTIKATTGHDGIDSSSSTGNLVITIQGSNDNPVVDATYTYDLNVSWDGTGAVTPENGQLVVTDADANEAVVQDTSNAGHPGAITSPHHNFYFLTKNGGAGDPESDDAQKFQSAEGKFGVLTVDPYTGKYVYTLNQYAPNLDTGGDERFVIYVADGHGGWTSQEITVHVAPVPSPPTGPGPSYDLTGTDMVVTEDKLETFGSDGSVRVWDEGQASGAPSGELYGFYVNGHFVTTVTGLYGTATIDPVTGKYVYVLNNSLAAVQELRQDAELTETLTLWHGAESSKITVTIKGTNDRPEVLLSDVHLSVTQTDGADAVTAVGTALATDIDQGDTHTFWLDAACTTKTQYYAFTLDGDGKIIGGPTLTSAAGAHFRVDIDPATGKYTLTYLAGGPHFTQDDTRDVSFTVYTWDNSGATDGSDVSEPQTVTVTINGTNAAPEWHIPLTNAVTEDNGLPTTPAGTNVTCSGAFLTDGGVTDDTGNSADSGLSFSINGSTSLLKGMYGTLLITDARTGAYTYTLDNALDSVQSLGVGEHVTETFTIRVTDKHGGYSEETVTITINGTNDAPTLNACSDLHLTATANSASATSANAAAVGHDVDVHDSLTYSFSYDASAGGDNHGLDYNDYGTFGIDPNTGRYTFTLDNSKDAVRSLSENDSVDLHFSVTVCDGHGGTASQDMVVHISGVNDAPEFVDGSNQPLADGVAVTGSLAWDAGMPLTGTVHAADAENDTLSYGIQGSLTGTYGDLTIDSATGQYTYTLHPGLTQDMLPPDATDKFTLVVSDGHSQNGTDTVDLGISITGGTAVSAPLSLSSLLTDVPQEGDSEVMANLLAEGMSLNELLGGGDRGTDAAVSAPAAQAVADAASFAAPVDLISPPGGEEEAMVRLVLEHQAG